MSDTTTDYINNAIKGFIKDPPDTEFQRGYLEALCVMASSNVVPQSKRLAETLASAEGLRHRPGKRRF